MVPRTGQGTWSPAADRPDPVRALVEANASRLPELLPIKWARMVASPFGFFRGAAPLMAADLAGRPVTGLNVQLCGDAHVLNLGAYAAPDGHLVFDLNDFDETVASGPWEWDAKRLAASLILANRQAGGKDGAGRDAVRAFVGSYRESLARFAVMRTMELMAYEVPPALEGTRRCGRSCKKPNAPRRRAAWRNSPLPGRGWRTAFPRPTAAAAPRPRGRSCERVGRLAPLP